MFNLKRFGNLLSKVKAASRSTCSIVLALCLVAVMLPTGFLSASAGDSTTGNWKDSAATAFAGGTGSPEDPFLISTPEQLARLLTLNQTQTNKNYKLTQDIDLAGKYWEPYGDSNKQFYGRINGDGYTIRNLVVDTTARYAGFIGFTNPVASFTNLHIEGTITQNYTGTGAAYAGGFVGQANTQSASPLVMTGCSFTGTVDSESAQSYVGGLVGTCSYITLLNCSVAGEVIGKQHVGGFSGSVHTFTVMNCYSAATVTFEGTLPSNKMPAIGGVVGAVNSTMTATNVYFDGSIENFPITRTQITDIPADNNVYYKQDSVKTTYLSTVYHRGAMPFTAAEINNVKDSFNQKVDALKAAGTEGLKYWTVKDNKIVFADLPNLSDLLLDRGALLFDSATLNYDVSVSGQATSLIVTPTAADDVTILVNDTPANSGEPFAVPLEKDTNATITVKVQRDGPSQTYTINVTRTNAWDGHVADGYAGGDGTQENPYLIATPDQLAYLAKQSRADSANTSKKYFKLTDDIDLGGVKWTTIGANSPTFGGYFDGDGHKVEGLYVKNPGNDAGLFGRTSYGWIRNLTVYGDVSSNEGFVGGIAGRLGGGASMTNCTFIGNVSGNMAVGGLVGSTNPYGGAADCVITNCWTDGTVTGIHTTTTVPAVGGLLGNNIRNNNGGSVTFTNCFSTMTVTTNSTKPAAEIVGIGGLCGDNSTSDPAVFTFDNCYFGGEINCAYPIVKPAHADASVTVTNVFYKEGSYTGTAAGAGVEDNKAVKVSADDVANGTLAEQLNNRVRVLKASGTTGIGNWKFEADGTPVFVAMPKLNGLSISCGNIVFDEATLNYTFAIPSTVTSVTVTATADDTVTIKVNNQILTNGSKKISLTGKDAVSISVTAERDGLVETYTIKILRPVTVSGVKPWDGTTVALSYEGGAGTQDDPYLIANAEQLAFMAKQLENGTGYSGRYFKLVADIDLGNHNWLPIGNLYHTEQENKYNAFAGTFDGDGHTVYNLSCTVTKDNGYYCTAALFGYTKNASIKNLNVKGFVVNEGTDDGWSLASGLIGRVESAIVIDNCSFTGEINSAFRAGGLIGLSYLGEITISGSWTEGSVKGSISTGGLIGFASGKTLDVSNCYSAMNVLGPKSATGGFVGDSYKDTAPETVFANCHFAGSVSQNPIMPKDLDSTTLNDVYYNANSVTGTPAGELDGAESKTVSEFSNGTVTGLLNRVLIGGTTWKNGPNGYPVTVAVPGGDALTRLLVNDAILKYDPSIFSYKVTLPYTADEVYFMPTAVDGAVVKVDGKVVESGELSKAVAIKVGVKTKFTIHVTNEGATKAYTVTVVRREKAPTGAWDGSIKAYVTKELGTSIKTPIAIENEAQLAFFSAMVNGYTLLLDGKVYKAPEKSADGQVYKDTYFQMKSDMKMNVLDDIANWETNAPYNNWEPAGIYGSGDAGATTRMFAGTIDGDHHIISGLYCNSDRKPEEGIGLFGSAGNATIRNIHIKNALIIGSQRIGGFVGYGRRTITLQNCSYSGTIKMAATKNTQSSFGGGIIGFSTTTKIHLNSCWSEGTLYGAQSCGGLVGLAVLYNGTQIENCYSSMQIISPENTENIGGLFGNIANNSVGNFTMRRCHFAGHIDTPAGSPILGYLAGNSVMASGEDIYYRAGSYTTAPQKELLLDAEEKTVEEFANGTVTELLNDVAVSGDFWNWKDGENGYPVSDGIILVTKYEYALNDSQFNDGNWADQFVNKEGGELINPGDGMNDDSNSDSEFGPGFESEDTPVTGEQSLYMAAIILLLISSVFVFLLARRKRSAN